MFIPTMQEDAREGRIVRLKKFNPAKVRRGHPESLSGGGVHKDRRSRRRRTRGDDIRHFLNDG